MAAGCNEVAEQLQHAFLTHCNEMTPYELFFGIVLPFLLVFAIIHYAMKEIWSDSQKEATIVALVLAMFPIPTGAYQWIGDTLQNIGDVLTGNTLPENANIPIFDSLFANATPEIQQAIVAVGFGSILALVLGFAGSGEERKELRKHEIIAVILLTAVVWMSMYTGDVGAKNPTSNMLNVATFAGILLLGAGMLWAAVKHGEGIKGWLTGFLGFGIVGWALTKLPSSYYPPAAEEFGQIILSGVMWVVAAALFIIVALVIVVFHIGGKK